MSNASERAFENERVRPAYLVILEGGTFAELYAHASESATAAEEFRISCSEGSYRTSDVIEVPAVLAAHGEELYELIEKVLRAERGYLSI